MANAAHQTVEPASKPDSIFSHMLEGFRFSVCQSPEEVARALDVRRQVYVDGVGYTVPVPDAYDHRSWILSAEDLSTGEVVGTLRLTPRSSGPVEAEEYFELPEHLENDHTYELNRFAILPKYRKGTTFLPIVSVGLFKLVDDFLALMGAHYMVVASKPERTWTYKWMLFEGTGMSAPYRKLGYTEHELLWHDFRRRPEMSEGHPFGEFFDMHFDEVLLPDTLPALDLVPESPEPMRLAVGA